MGAGLSLGPESQFRTFSVSKRRSRAEINANALKLLPGASNVCLTVRELKILVPRAPKRSNPVEFAVVDVKKQPLSAPRSSLWPSRRRLGRPFTIGIPL